MFARLTTFRVKPDKFDEMRQWREENEAAIYAQPGLRHWSAFMDQNGEVFVLAVFDDIDAARNALPQARALWSQMMPMIEGEPTARFLEVMAMRDVAMQGVVTA